MTDRVRDPGPLYETLARFQWWRRRLAGRRPGEGLELRKRLLPPLGDGPADGAAGLDEWLLGLLPAAPGRRVLDLGCGFGASLLRWVQAGAGSGCGVTASRFQAAAASAEARRRGLGERAHFVVQDFAAPVAGAFDVVLAIESLGHARSLDAQLRAVRDALVPGGHFLWVEDLLREPMPGDADVDDLARRWASPPLADVATARRLLLAAGLTVVREFDLSGQVAFASPVRLQRSGRCLARWRALLPLPPVRRLCDAFLGGQALERLYARGRACYRVWMAMRPSEAA